MRRHARKILPAAVCLSALLIGTGVHAQAPARPSAPAGQAVEPGAPARPARPTTVQNEAAERFDRGLTRYSAGDHAAALAEFERAYALAPHPVVLFNIGLVQAKLNRPVEALAAFDRLFASTAAGDSSLSASQRDIARKTRAEQALRVAEVTITTDVPAAIDVDGIEVARTPGGPTLRIKAGTRVIAARSASGASARKEITIAGGEARALAFSLATATSEPARVVFSTSLPDVEVLVDGKPVARTPLVTALTVEPGRRIIEMRRPGYQPRRQEVDLGAGATAEIPFALVASPEAPAGRLLIAVRPDDAEIVIDGLPLAHRAGSVPLPSGAHRVALSRVGFLPVVETVAVTVGEERRFEIALTPTAETRAAHVKRVDGRRFWGRIAFTAGVLTVAGALTYALVNHKHLDEARAERRALEDLYEPGQRCYDATGPDRPSCDARVEANRSDTKDRQLKRTLGFVGLGVGLGVAVIGTTLLATAGDGALYGFNVEWDVAFSGRAGHAGFIARF